MIIIFVLYCSQLDIKSPEFVIIFNWSSFVWMSVSAWLCLLYWVVSPLVFSVYVQCFPCVVCDILSVARGLAPCWSEGLSPPGALSRRLKDQRRRQGEGNRRPEAQRRRRRGEQKTPGQLVREIRKRTSPQTSVRSVLERKVVYLSSVHLLLAHYSSAIDGASSFREIISWIAKIAASLSN